MKCRTLGPIAIFQAVVCATACQAVGFSAGGFLSLHGNQKQEFPVLSVCDIFMDRATYAGGLLRLKGPFFPSRHLVTIGSGRCDHSLSTEGVKWPAQLQVALEDESNHDLGELIMALAIVGRSYQIELLMEGTVEWKSDFHIERRDERLLGNGFGYTGITPGRVKIRRVVSFSGKVAD